MNFSVLRQLLSFGSLGRGTLIAALGLWTRAALQAVYLVLVSRWLGASGYGLFSGSTAAIMLFSPLAGFGLGLVFTDYAARGELALAALWSWTEKLALLCAVVAAVMALSVIIVALPMRVDAVTLVLLAASELVAVPLTATATSALMVSNRADLAMAAVNLIPVVRIAGLLILLGFGVTPDLSTLAVTHFLGSACGTIWVIRATRRVMPADTTTQVALPAWKHVFRDGFAYALGNSVSASYPEIDKVLILESVGADATGVYTAAFRVVSVFSLPVIALLSNAQPRLFAEQRSDSGRRVLKAVIAAAMGYAVLGALLAFALAPLMPYIFGISYLSSSAYVKLLAAWVPLSALHLAGAAALLAAQRKTARLIVESIGLLLIVLLNVILLPHMGAAGAALALILGELAMILGCWSVYILGKNHKVQTR